jgi:tetratricopeptide (TPR) repeat protein
VHLRLVGIVSLAALLVGRAAAADPRTEKAREHYQQGDAYYKLDKYADALHEYEQAYIAKPDPSFLYNIAQCHRLTGDRAEALKFYRRYLRDAPDAPNRAIAEKHIHELEAALAHPVEPSHAAEPPPGPGPAPLAPLPTTPPPSPPPPTIALAAPPPGPSPPAAVAVKVAPEPNEDQHAAPAFYTRWWFWTAVGAVAAGTILLVATAGHDPGCPQRTICK